MTATPFTLDAVLTGKAVAYTRPGSCSAIDKQLRTGELTVNELGLGGDEQGDLRVHGGKDKAIHHYPREHYALWAGELGAQTLLQAPGAFGENFSTYGCTEQTVCLGDRFRVGTALLEISQGRMPCWKLNDRFGVKDMSLRVQQTGRTGWYYRVLEEGVLAAGASFELIARPHPHWSVARLSAVLFDKQVDAAVIRQCLELHLAPSWRRTLERRLEKAAVEDWSPRLLGPQA